MRSTFIVFTIIMFFTTDLFSASLRKNVAEVVKVRGKVTQLRPGAMSASKITKGQRLKEDTSVLTSKKSFVSIKMDDGSRVNLGPNSKFVINKLDEREGGIISLLKGKMRTKVQKENNSKKNKLFIRTRTAAMGVRGTDFQTVYNPENRVTSLLTYKGKVAMVKVDEKDQAISKKVEKKIDRVSRTEVVVEDAPDLPETNVQTLDKLLEREEAVVVEKGQFSGTAGKINRVSEPVKISPVQLGILFRNDEFKAKKNTKVRSANLADLESNPYELEQAPQEAPPEGFYDEKTGKYAPKAGGVLDLESGLYIPPTKDSEFDAKRGVFVVKEVGKVDEETGQYVAPKGLVLNAKKGFVVDKKSTKDQTLLAKANSLNTIVATDLILESDEVETEESIRVFTMKERFAKDSVYITIKSFDHSLAARRDFNIGGNSLDQDGKGFRLTWNHGSGSNWQLVTALGVDFVDFRESHTIVQDSDKLVDTKIGVRYSMSPRWQLMTALRIDQDLFVNREQVNNVDTTQISKAAITKLYLGLEGNLILSSGGRFSLDTEFGVVANSKKEAAGLEIKPAIGFEVKLAGSYWFTSNFQASLGLWGEVHDRDLERATNSFLAEGKQDSTGLDLTFGYLF